MSTCSQCGRQNPDRAHQCAACGAPIQNGPSAPAEVGHLEFILTQIPLWRAQGIIPPGSASRLTTAVRKRLAELAETGGPHAVSAVAVTRPHGAAQPPIPPAYEPAKAEPDTPRPDIGIVAGLAAFFEAHWIKLLAVLASALILAGVRQVMGVEWVEQVALLAVPLVPMGLSAALARWVLRARERESIAARACGGIAIVLVPFAVAAINKHWLSGAIPATWSLLIGAAAGALAALTFVRAASDRVYLHYGMAFTVLSSPLLMAAASGARRLEHVQPWHAAVGLALVGSVLLGLALLARCGWFESGRPRIPILLTWGSAATWAAVAAAAVQAGLSEEHMPTTVGVLFVCATASGVTGTLVRSGAFAAASVVAAALAGVVLMPGRDTADTFTWGFLALGLGTLWAGAGIQHTRSDGPNPAALMFGRSGVFAFAVAGLMLVMGVLEAVGNAQPLGGTGWERVALLGLGCAVAYAAISVVSGKPDALYAAAGALALAVGAAFSAWMRATRFQTIHHAGHDMAAASAALLLVGVLSARFLTAVTRLPLERLLAPWLRTGAVVAAVGIVTSIGWMADRAMDAGAWVALMALSGTAGGGYWLTKGVADRLSAQGLMGVGLAGIVAIAGLAGFVQLQQIGAGAALMVAALACIAYAAYLDPFSPAPGSETNDETATGRSDSAVAVVPLRLVGGLAYGAATIALAYVPAIPGSGNVAFAFRAGAILSAAATAFAWSGAWRSRHDPTSLVLATLTLCQCWLLYLMHSTSPVAGLCSAGSAAYAAAFARTARSETVMSPWLSAVAAVLAWLGAMRWIGSPIADWTALAMLPGLTVMYALSELARIPQPLRAAMRRTAASAVVVTILAAEVASAGERESDVRLAVTAGAFALAMAYAAYRRTSPFWASTSAGLWTLTASHAMFAADLTHARWALGFVACAVVFPIAVRAMAHIEGCARARRSLGAIAAAHVLLGAVVALAGAPRPDGGATSVTTIALAGLVLAALYASGLGTVHMHAAAGCFLVAHALFVYSRVQINAGVLDLYLLPLGVYLLTLGYVANRRSQTDEAAVLWWTGALVVMSPTFVAFWTHFVHGGPVWHAILLIAECIVALVWGIAHRIRAFVISGAGFALAFALVLVSASVQEVWIGLIALLVGLALLGAVIQLSTRAEATRAWLERLRQEWRRWR